MIHEKKSHEEVSTGACQVWSLKLSSFSIMHVTFFLKNACPGHPIRRELEDSNVSLQQMALVKVNGLLYHKAKELLFNRNQIEYYRPFDTIINSRVK